jgi:beta-glucanase (GH16 family)
MIWNKNTGGEHLLNDNYAGYLLDENVYTKKGHLFLDNKKQVIQGINPFGTFNYSTGWINSLQKINFNGTQKHTYIQLKAKFPRGDKVWPAIWLIDDSENRGWPPEIDIWEYFGIFFNTVKTDQMYMRFIYGKGNDKKDHSVPIENFQEKYNAADEWHIYGFEWTHEKMNWFIDGEKVHTKTKGVDVPAGDWPNKKMCLVINNGLLNVVDEGNTTYPNSLILDYLEIYQQ